MDSTALELYRSAYHSHYAKGNLELACRQYRQIVQTYPHSREASYAILQLERIASPLPQEEPNQSVRAPALLVAVVVLLTLLCAALGAGGFWLYREQVRTRQSLQEGVAALAIWQGGNQQQARERVVTLLNREPSNPLAAALLMELFVSAQQFDQAVAVYTNFRAAGGDSTVAERELRRIDFLRRQQATAVRDSAPAKGR